LQLGQGEKICLLVRLDHFAKDRRRAAIRCFTSQNSCNTSRRQHRWLGRCRSPFRYRRI